MDLKEVFNDRHFIHRFSITINRNNLNKCQISIRRFNANRQESFFSFLQQESQIIEIPSSIGIDYWQTYTAFLVQTSHCISLVCSACQSKLLKMFHDIFFETLFYTVEDTKLLQEKENFKCLVILSVNVDQELNYLYTRVINGSVCDN